MASRVEDFSNLVRENGLSVSKLDTDIVVNVKTLHSIYQLEMTQDHRIFIKGGKIGAAIPVTHLASMINNSYKMDWILWIAIVNTNSGSKYDYDLLHPRCGG